MTATTIGESARTRSPWSRLRSRLTGRAAAPAVGVIAALIAVVGSGNPSYWGDEAASVLAAQRPLPVLIDMLGHVDAVHGLYYLFLHAWIGAFGSSEFIVRFPSAIAVGLAAAGTVLLSRALFRSSTGIAAGLVFAVIPQVTRMGMEARSYALGMAAAVWLTLWFVTLVRRRTITWRSWALYAVAAAAALYLFLYLGMLLVVHAIYLLLHRPGRAVVRAWSLSLVGALVLATPILIAGFSQRGQIAFLAHRDYATVWSALVGQWFDAPVFAVLAWTLIVLAPVGILLRRPTTAQRDGDERPGLGMIATWVVVPTTLLLLGNAFLTPMYNLRYVAFCTPAVAIMMALGLRTLVSAIADSPRHGVRVNRAALTAIGLLLIAAIATPTIVEQRGPFAKDDGSDLRQTAELVGAVASPGDAIVFDESVKPSRRPRLALDLYPKSFSGLDDIALLTSYRDLPQLWDRVAPLTALHDQLAAHPVVWVVEVAAKAPDVVTLREFGYEVEQTIMVHRTTVFQLVKE